MESTHDSGDRWEELKSNYAQSLASGVDLPRWAAKSFSPAELAVLGAVRGAAYKAPSGGCSLTVSEIAQLAEVDLRTVTRAITMAIAGGLIERGGGGFFVATSTTRLDEVHRQNDGCCCDGRQAKKTH